MIIININTTTYQIALRRCEACSLKIKIYKDRDVYQPSSSDEFILTVRASKSVSSEEIMRFTVNGDGVTTMITFNIPTTATENIKPATYYYDVWLKQGESLSPIIPVSSFVVEHSLVEREVADDE